jgi:hypothetical protein
MLLCSCQYKDLCYDHSHMGEVRVAYDWSQSHQADVKGMTVLFYHADNVSADPIRYDFTGMEGGTARLTMGSYRPSTYNYDTETILYRGMENPSSLEAYTRKSSIEEGTQLSTRNAMPRAATTEDQPVILEPDPLYGTAGNAFTLDPNTQTTVTLQPHRRFKEISLKIINVPNLQYTGQFGGALTGLAASIYMEDGQLSDDLATEAFTIQVVDGSTLVGKLRIFGHCPNQNNKHYLTIYAILADGTQWYYTIDVTDQMHPHGPDDPGSGDDDDDITIEIDGLPVPKPIVNGSGFQPTIDGWQGVDIDVGM